jgi:hypothetical protein
MVCFLLNIDSAGSCLKAMLLRALRDVGRRHSTADRPPDARVHGSFAHVGLVIVNSPLRRRHTDPNGVGGPAAKVLEFLGSN